MSLVRIAARIALVEALKGRTLVGDNVLDSRIGLFDQAADGSVHTSQDKPFAGVYTDAAVARGDDLELRSLRPNGQTIFVIEYGVGTAMMATNNQGESVLDGLAMPATDDALEFHLDMVGRQIANTLTDPGNEWAELFRTLCFSFLQIDLKRTVSGDKATRLAGHQMAITAMLMDDPARGEPVPEPFQDLFARLDASGNAVLVARSALMQAELTGSNAPWEAVQRRMGMTAPELLALGLGPMAGDEDRATPEFTEGSADIEGTEPIAVIGE